MGYEGAVGSLAGLGPRRSHTRAVVQVTGTASRIAAVRFRKAAEESEAIHSIIVRYGEMLLIQVQQTAACNALHEVEARLSRWLLQARDRLESNIIKLTHEFLSQMLGVRRTTVTVVANSLQRAKLIRYHRGQIEIVDRPGLEARACECYEAIRRQIDQVIPLALVAAGGAAHVRADIGQGVEAVGVDFDACRDGIAGLWAFDHDDAHAAPHLSQPRRRLPQPKAAADIG